MAQLPHESEVKPEDEDCLAEGGHRFGVIVNQGHDTKHESEEVYGRREHEKWPIKNHLARQAAIAWHGDEGYPGQPDHELLGGGRTRYDGRNRN